VKADRESKNREGLSHASKAVNASTAQVVATAKNCAAIIEEKSTNLIFIIDFIFQYLIPFFF
jgi:hypothetical protein